jgi:hypothetical protein
VNDYVCGYPAQLPPAYAIGDGDSFIEIVCEDHAREYAETNGLVWRGARGVGWTEETDTKNYAYQIWPGDGETDTPYTCGDHTAAGYCGVLLDCRLTAEGEDYLREFFPASVWYLWGVDA